MLLYTTFIKVLWIDYRNLKNCETIHSFASNYEEPGWGGDLCYCPFKGTTASESVFKNQNSEYAESNLRIGKYAKVIKHVRRETIVVNLSILYTTFLTLSVQSRPYRSIGKKTSIFPLMSVHTWQAVCPSSCCVKIKQLFFIKLNKFARVEKSFE